MYFMPSEFYEKIFKAEHTNHIDVRMHMLNLSSKFAV